MPMEAWTADTRPAQGALTSCLAFMASTAATTAPVGEEERDVRVEKGEVDKEAEKIMKAELEGDTPPVKMGIKEAESG